MSVRQRSGKLGPGPRRRANTQVNISTLILLYTVVHDFLESLDGINSISMDPIIYMYMYLF